MPPMTTQLTTTPLTTTPLMTTPPTSPPSGSFSWQHYPAMNCFGGHGATPIGGADPLPGTYTLAECKAKCAESANCELLVMRDWVASSGSSPCWLRENVKLDECIRDYPDFHSWVIPHGLTA